MRRIAGKAEKTEALREFHHGTRFGLLRCGTFSHLFLGADDPLGILPAAAQIDGDTETPVVDPNGLLQDVQTNPLESFSKASDGFTGGRALSWSSVKVLNTSSRTSLFILCSFRRAPLGSGTLGLESPAASPRFVRRA